MPGHGEAVGDDAVTQGVGAQMAFLHKAETLIEGDGAVIIGEDSEFEAGEAKPVIREVEQGGEQRGADALAVIGVAHHDADHAGMGAATRMAIKRGGAGDDAALLGDQQMVVRAEFGEIGFGVREAAERQRERAMAHFGQVADGGEGGRVARLGGADGEGRGQAALGGFAQVEAGFDAFNPRGHAV